MLVIYAQGKQLLLILGLVLEYSNYFKFIHVIGSFLGKVDVLVTLWNLDIESSKWPDWHGLTQAMWAKCQKAHRTKNNPHQKAHMAKKPQKPIELGVARGP